MAIGNSKHTKEDKKNKKVLAKQEKLKESIIQTKLDIWQLNRRIEVSEQLISANIEQKHILEYMTELIRNDRMDTPEFKQLLNRYKMLETFCKDQRMIYNTLKE